MIRWYVTSYVHADDFICRREFLSHINCPRTIPRRQIENTLWASPEFIENIPLKERLKRFMAMVYYMCVFADPPLAEILGGSKRTEHRGSSSRMPCERTTVSEEELDTLRNSIRIRLDSTWRVRDRPFPAKGETNSDVFPALFLRKSLQSLVALRGAGNVRIP